MRSRRHLLPVLLAAALPAQELRLPLDRAADGWRGATAIADGRTGGAARFDGATAHIDAGPCPVRDDQPFTLRLWLRTTRGEFCTPLMARAGEAVGLSVVVGREPGCVSFEAWSWRTVKLIAHPRIDDGQWHHLEVAYEPTSTTALLWLDGRIAAAAALGRGGSPAAELRLGDNLGAHQPFAGDLDEVELLPTTAPAEAFADFAPVLPPGAALRALAALRTRLLPEVTPSLAADRLGAFAARRTEVRRHVLDCLGLAPEPPRQPLDLQVHGERAFPGGKVQRVTWAGCPGQRASGWLWLPDPLPAAPAPAMLCPHGHWSEGAVDPTVQMRCLSFVRFGWPVLAVDSVHVEDVASGVSSIGVMTWHNVRAVDVLAALPYVDPKRLGVTGASGGGQQTYYLMAIEDRLAAAAPMVMTCYLQEILTDTDAHCTCNHLPRLAAGTDVPEMAAVFAPRPALFGSVTGDWTHSFPERGLPELTALWTSLGAGKALRSRHAAEGHNYDRPMREVVYGFFHDALLGPAADGVPRARVAEPDVQPLPVPALRALGGPPFRSAPDRAALAREFVARRPKVQDLAALAPGLPPVLGALLAFVDPPTARWRRGTLTAADDVPIPLRLHDQADDDAERWLVVVHPDGMTGALAAAPPWLTSGRRVVLVEPRWCGEWRPFAPYWRRNGLMLGQGEGYQQAHDLAALCQALPGRAPVTLVGLGNTGVGALLAATLSPRINHVVADDLGPDYARDGNRLPLCPELLRHGDLPDLLARLAATTHVAVGGTGTTPRLDADALAAAVAAR